MANNSVVIDLLLQDAKFKLSIDKATGSAQDLKKAVDDVSKPLSSLRKGLDGVKDGMGGILDSVFSIKGALAAVAGLFTFDKIIEAASEADQALQGAANSLRLTGEFSNEALADVTAFAGRLQDLTGLGDDTALSMFALAKSFGLTKDQAKLVVAQANDLAAATGQDLNTAVTALSATFNGNIGKLAKLNPALKNLTEAELQAGKAAEILGKQFAGSAAARLQTFGGALDALKGRFGDLLEEIGFVIVQNPAVIEAFNALGVAIKQASSRIAGIAPNLKQITANALTDFVEILSQTIKSLQIFARAVGILYRSSPLGALVDILTRLGDKLSVSGGFAVAAAEKFVLLSRAVLTAYQTFLKVPSLVQKVFGFETITESLGIDGAISDLASLEERIKSFRESGIAGSVGEALGEAKGPIDDLTDSLDSLVESLKKVDATQFKVAASKVAGGGAPTGPRDTGFDNSPTAFFDAALAEILSSTKAFLEDVGKSVLENVLGGKEGARKVLGGITEGIGAAFGSPEAGKAIAPFIEALSQGKDVVKQQVEEFASALPELISNLIDAIPIFIETLADHADEIIIAIVDGIPKITSALIISFSNPEIYRKVAQGLSQAAVDGLRYQIEQFRAAMGIAAETIKTAPADFGREFKQWASEAGAKIAQAAKEFVDNIKTGAARFIDDLISESGRFIDKLIDEIQGAFKVGGGGKAAIGGSGKGKVENTLGVDIPGVYAATGALVKGSGNRDSVPAMLSPGELVLDRTTGPRLNAFIDRATQANQPTPSDGISEVMLAKIIDLLQRPMTVETRAEVDGKGLADIILTLSRTNQRIRA